MTETERQIWIAVYAAIIAAGGTVSYAQDKAVHAVLFTRGSRHTMTREVLASRDEGEA